MSFSHRSSVQKDKKPFKGGKGKDKNKQGKAIDGPKPVKKAVLAGGRDARLNTAKQIQKNKKDAVMLAKRLGTDQGPPKVVALIPLSKRVNLVEPLNLIQSACEDDSLVAPTNSRLRLLRSNITRPKQRLIVYAAPRTVDSVLDIAKVADILLFVVAPNEEGNDVDHDEMAWQLTTVIKAQGVPSVLGLVQGANSLPPSKKQHLQTQAARFFSTALEYARKPMSIDSPDDASVVIRALASLKLNDLGWRSNRSYLLAETVEVRINADQKTASVRIAGHLRGSSKLGANNLVHATGFGDFQIEQLDIISRTSKAKLHHQEKNSEQAQVAPFTVEVHSRPDGNQESLVALLPIDEMNREQSIITDEELQAAEMEHERAVPGSLQKFQAVWDDIGSDNEDGKGNDEDPESARALDQVGDNEMDEGDASMDTRRKSSAGLSSLATGLSSKTSGEKGLIDKKKLERDEVEFPDEVETPVGQPCRVRFARYRGMKSFQQSAWDPKENLPLEYGHLSQFENFAAAAKRVQHDAGAKDDTVALGCGMHCVVQLGMVSVSAAERMLRMEGPLLLWALYQYERQVSVLHTRVRRHREDQDPFKAKENLTVHLGFRRFTTKPIFTHDTGRGDRAMTQRFFHPEQWAVASFYGHIFFPPAPVLMFRPAPIGSEVEMQLLGEGEGTPYNPMLASGSLMSIDPDRLLIKRIILTGNPVGVHKNAAVVRHMFFNPEDIKWFKPVEVRTKFGLNGHIVEPRGTKGMMDFFFFVLVTIVYLSIFEIYSTINRTLLQILLIVSNIIHIYFRCINLYTFLRLPLYSNSAGLMRCRFDGHLKANDTVFLACALEKTIIFVNICVHVFRFA
jgi:pre-rRNA-processing protein TSR1